MEVAVMAHGCCMSIATKVTAGLRTALREVFLEETVGT